MHFLGKKSQISETGKFREKTYLCHFQLQLGICRLHPEPRARGHDQASCTMHRRDWPSAPFLRREPQVLNHQLACSRFQGPFHQKAKEASAGLADSQREQLPSTGNPHRCGHLLTTGYPRPCRHLLTSLSPDTSFGVSRRRWTIQRASLSTQAPSARGPRIEAKPGRFSPENSCPIGNPCPVHVS